eukprot:GGOE01020982.1.p1 GENE.GGOE01020982.1~~GGOE01020982.1.p1  ORF type:complete len:412 (+),score=18.93 GGOE01020982.1:64-1299(+)
MAQGAGDVRQLLCQYYEDPARVTAKLPCPRRRKRHAFPWAPLVERPPWDDSQSVLPCTGPAKLHRSGPQRGVGLPAAGCEDPRSRGTAEAPPGRPSRPVAWDASCPTPTGSPSHWMAAPCGCSLRSCAAKRKPAGKPPANRKRCPLPTSFHDAAPSCNAPEKPPSPRKSPRAPHPWWHAETEPPTASASTPSLPSRLKSKVWESRCSSTHKSNPQRSVAKRHPNAAYSLSSSCTEQAVWEADRWAREQAWRREADLRAAEGMMVPAARPPLPRRSRPSQAPAPQKVEMGDPPEVEHLLRDGDRGRRTVECEERCVWLRTMSRWWFGVLAIHQSHDERRLMEAEDRKSHTRQAAERQQVLRNRRRWRRVQEERCRQLMRTHDAPCPFANRPKHAVPSANPASPSEFSPNPSF